MATRIAHLALWTLIAVVGAADGDMKMLTAGLLVLALTSVVPKEPSP